MNFRAYILELVVFVCGAVVMVFELVGSRMLGPYFGTSIFVWTSLIGIVLGSLSLGYYIGGIIADKKPSEASLAFIISLSAAFVGITLFLKDFLLMYLPTHFPDIRITSVLASLILFSPASVLLGIVSPYAVKLKLNDLKTSGATVGNLYAISTAGSIFGTFLAGFYLIPHFGTNKLLLILALSLLVVAVLLSLKKNRVFNVSVLATIFLSWTILSMSLNLRENGLIDIDTAYNRVWIYDYVYPENDLLTKVMGINNENHSSMYLRSDELVNEYTKYYRLARHFSPGLKTTLMFGGAAYSYPRDFLREYPSATIDVVEIDPQLTELARRYFRLEDNPRLSIYHEDGRVFLNKATKKYDAIFGDAFASHYSVPYQLTTQEAVQRQFDILEDQGVVILNVISSIEGARGQFLRAEYATYRSIFPQVYLFPVGDAVHGTVTQNIMLVALKTDKRPEMFSQDYPELNAYLQHLWKKEVEADMPVLTDDFAPVDNYMSRAI